jgi:hypothetical protein
MHEARGTDLTSSGPLVHASSGTWDEVEAAYHWWLYQGEPRLDQWRFTVSPDRQTANLQ